MGVAEPGERAIAALEQGANPTVPLVEALREEPLQALHAGGEILLRSLDEEVVVRAEQTQRVARPIELVENATQEPDETVVICLVPEDHRRPGSTIGHVIDAGRLNARNTNHAPSVGSGGGSVRRRDEIGAKKSRSGNGV